MAGGPLRILFIGDIVGGIGRRTVEALLPTLRERLEPTFVIANGENAAGGAGITPKVASRLFESGIDVLTLGNHAYRHREVYPYLDEEPRIVRPANYLRSQPGHGWCVVNRGDVRLGVVSISGNLFMNAGRAAFPEADAVLHTLVGKVDHILVDMHAEATSEKVAMGWHLDGRVAAVLGTHTHVATADARVLPRGTAFLCDAGMTGPHDSILGREVEPVVARFLDGMPRRFEVAAADVRLSGVRVDIDRESGLARGIERVEEREEASN